MPRHPGRRPSVQSMPSARAYSRAASAVSSRTMPTIAKLGIVGVARVERLQRRKLVLARDAPRVPEVHDHDLAGQIRVGERGRRLVEQSRPRSSVSASRATGSSTTAAAGRPPPASPARPRTPRRRRRRRARPSARGASCRHRLRITFTAIQRIGRRLARRLGPGGGARRAATPSPSRARSLHRRSRAT